MLTSLSSCREENFVDLFWNQTLCADPWAEDQGNDNETTMRAVKSYLFDYDIIPLIVDFDNNSPLPIGCKACSCAHEDGQRILVTVSDDDKETMIELGFYEE